MQISRCNCLPMPSRALANPPLKLGHGWMIASNIKPCLITYPYPESSSTVLIKKCPRCISCDLATVIWEHLQKTDPSGPVPLARSPADDLSTLYGPQRSVWHANILGLWTDNIMIGWQANKWSPETRLYHVKALSHKFDIISALYGEFIENRSLVENDGET